LLIEKQRLFLSEIVAENISANSIPQSLNKLFTFTLKTDELQKMIAF
jgi:hypothetical protein